MQALFEVDTIPPGDAKPGTHPVQAVLADPEYPGELKERTRRVSETKRNLVQIEIIGSV